MSFMKDNLNYKKMTKTSDKFKCVCVKFIKDGIVIVTTSYHFKEREGSMKKRLFKKICAGTLIAATAVSLAACGGGDQPSEEQSSATEQTSTTSGSTGEESTSGEITSVSDIAINEVGTDATGHEGEEAPEGIQEGTVLNYWTNYDVPKYCPWMDNRAAVLTYQVYSNLLVKNKGNSEDIVCDIAESYEVSDDGLVWTFKIREDAKFSDGCAVEAGDFVATWDVMQEYQPRPLANVESYEAVDEHTLVVTLKTADPTFIYGLPTQRTYGVVCSEELEKYGPEDNRSAVGAGPFYIESYDSGKQYVLKAIEDYWNEDLQAHIETVNIQVIADENTALMGLMNGSINIMNTVDIEVMNNVVDNGLNLALITDRENPFWFNARQVEIFKDPVVREALIHMVNWDELSALVYDGLYPHPNSYFTGPEAPEYSDKYTYDPELGLQMLEDAGYALEDIQFEILADPDFTNLCVALVQQFNDLGLTNITTQTYDGATCYGMLKAGTYDMFPVHNGYGQDTPLDVFTMGLIEGGTQPVMFLKDIDEAAYEEAVGYYEAAESSSSLEEYRENITKLENLVQEQCLALGGLQVVRGFAFTNDVRGAYIAPESAEIQMSYLYFAE